MAGFDEMGTIEYEYYDDRTGEGDGLPRVNWHYGDKKMKTPGDFYTKAAAWDGDLPEPWQAVDRFDDEPGWAAPALRILPITYRIQAFEKDGEGTKARRVYLEKWVKGASLHTEILCLIDGMVESGPVVWSVTGGRGKAITGKGGIFPTAQAALHTPAAKVLGKKVPMYAFWLPIATALDLKGKTLYLETEQGSITTPPALHLPAGKEGRDLLNELYVGKDLLAHAAELRAEYEGWRTTLREVEAAVAAPARGRNAPQPLSDDDFGEAAPF